MQPAMKSLILPFLCLVALLSSASGLTLEGVRLVNNLDYISYKLGPSASNSLLECVYHLDETEEVDRVFWEMWNDVENLGFYLWRPGSVGYATGSLTGVVELNRDDGSLELTKLRYDLGGNYSCGVSLTNGLTKTADKEEVLIVDIEGKIKLSELLYDCSCNSSFQSLTVFPEQTVHAGMFSPMLNEYYEEVPSHEWEHIVYANGSAVHSYNGVTFQINEKTPDDIVFKLKRGIYKADGEFISLGGISTSKPSWHELGCPDVREDNKTVKYFPENSATCRGGRKDMTTATVTCSSGYHAEGNVTVVKVKCDDLLLMWKPEPGYAANLEDLVCVEDSHHHQ